MGNGYLMGIEDNDDAKVCESIDEKLTGNNNIFF